MRNRLRKATVLAARLAYMAAPRSARANLVNGTLYPMAFYAVEVISIPAKEVSMFTTKITDLLMPKHTTRRSRELFWAFASEKLITPARYAARRRCDAIRVARQRMTEEKLGSSQCYSSNLCRGPFRRDEAQRCPRCLCHRRSTLAGKKRASSQVAVELGRHGRDP